MADRAGTVSKLTLARTFSACVECFGLIHPAKEWNREQHLLLTALGIQQGRLLIWGANMGITELGEGRDPRLDDPDLRAAVESALHTIIHRPSHVTREEAFEKYGLKPPKKFTSAYQPALDVNRLESFREKYYDLQYHEHWEERRGMSITSMHWTVTDNAKFANFVKMCKENIDSLIALMGNGDHVDRAMKHDIRALGWHPVFEKSKASRDMSSLRLIRDACKDEYPEYSATTEGALKYLEGEWAESYGNMMVQTQPSEYGTPRSKSVGNAEMLKVKRPGLFSRLSHNFRKKSYQGDSKSGLHIPADDSTRSKSVSHAPSMPAVPDELALATIRSKSMSDAVGVRPDSGTSQTAMDSSMTRIETATSQGSGGSDPMGRVETAKSNAGSVVYPIQSMISRHDQWKPNY